VILYSSALSYGRNLKGAEFMRGVRRVIRGAIRRFKSPLKKIQSFDERLTAIHGYLLYNEFGQRQLRTQLLTLRNSAGYHSIFEEDNPLITVTIPTHTSPASLWEVTLPSIQNQSHTNLEILICINPININAWETALRHLEEIDDPRIRMVQCLGPTPKQQDWIPAWHNSGTLETNCGLEHATGSWISVFSHDDFLIPTALESLLKKCRFEKLEFCYGDFSRIIGTQAEVVCSNPPMLTKFNFQGSLMHSGINFFQFSPTDAILGMPNDWGSLLRMISTGVKIGHFHEVTANYFPSNSRQND
jgi:hypothetical protein